jgi:hypothetical protein
MRTSWISKGLLTLTVLLSGALACDEEPKPAAVVTPVKDVCPDLVAKVKAQCGEDSPAYKKHKQLYIDKAPTGEPQSDADAQMRVRRLRACQSGLAVADEKLDYSVEPDFSVGNDTELQAQAAAAKKHWQTRKAAYEKMSSDEKAKDEAAQVQQRCMLWVLG